MFIILLTLVYFKVRYSDVFFKYNLASCCVEENELAKVSIATLPCQVCCECFANISSFKLENSPLSQVLLLLTKYPVDSWWMWKPGFGARQCGPGASLSMTLLPHMSTRKDLEQCLLCKSPSVILCWVTVWMSEWMNGASQSSLIDTISFACHGNPSTNWAVCDQSPQLTNEETESWQSERRLSC